MSSNSCPGNTHSRTTQLELKDILMNEMLESNTVPVPM